MKITEQDYSKITELITMKRNFTLDVERVVTEDDLEDSSLYADLTFGGNPNYYGNIESEYIYGATDDKWTRSRFKIFTQPDGETAVEISFLPGMPYLCSDEHTKAVWDNTRLDEIMGYDEYRKDIEEEADWVEACFGHGGDLFELLFEVTKPDVPSVFEDEADRFLHEPLEFQHKGNQYNLNVFYIQD